MRTAAALLCCLLFAGCGDFRKADETPDTSGFDLEAVRNEMRPLNLAEPFRAGEAVQNYFSFYGLNPANAPHWFGTVESRNQTLAAHVFLPAGKPRGTLFLLHGCFDHTGTLSRLIAEALAHGYAVACWDLPGHGLSTGGRTETGSFTLCAEQFSDITARAMPHLPRPFHLAAHSTGCSIALEHLHNESHAFEKIIFMAPLVQHKHWGWGKFGRAVAKPFAKTIRRRDVINSSDTAYSAFVKKDPLHSGVLSFGYLDDLYAWEKKARAYPMLNASVLILQGDRDNVVDWNHNLEFLKTRIRDPDIKIIPGANHQLANESEQLRAQVFELIFQELQSAAAPSARTD